MRAFRSSLHPTRSPSALRLGHQAIQALSGPRHKKTTAQVWDELEVHRVDNEYLAIKQQDGK